MNRYKDMTIYICNHGHIKYVRKFSEPVICNICGSKKFEIATGLRNGMSKLNERKVLEILSKVHEEIDVQKVANEYNVHYVTIWDIWKRRTWKHVEL